MKPGIYNDMSIEDYHSDRTVISSTGLRKAKKSTRDFLYYVLYGTEKKSYFDFGNAFEIALMDRANGSKLFEKSVRVMPEADWRQAALTNNPDLVSPGQSKVYKTMKAEWESDLNGHYVIGEAGAESAEYLEEMVLSCVSNPTINRLLSETEYQSSLFWKDESGIMCKTRPDICKSKKNVIVSIKTCQDASEAGFARECAKHDYYLQAAMEMDGAVKSGLMKKVDNYFWLAVEKTPGFDFALHELQQEDFGWLHDSYKFYLNRCVKGLALLKEGFELCTAPSYGEAADNKFGILAMDIPLYYRNQS